jgi:hypothetical protein
MRQLFSEWSDRTFARYWKAHKRLAVLVEVGAITKDDWTKAIIGATRPNGGLNVVKFDQITEDMAAMWIARHEAENGGVA